MFSNDGYSYLDNMSAFWEAFDNLPKNKHPLSIL